MSLERHPRTGGQSFKVCKCSKVCKVVRGVRFHQKPLTTLNLQTLNLQTLLQNHHLPQRRHFVRLQLVEIDTTRNAFAECIPTIPIRRTTPRRVVTRDLMSEFQNTHQRATRIVDVHTHSRAFRQLIRYPRLGLNGFG